MFKILKSKLPFGSTLNLYGYCFWLYVDICIVIGVGIVVGVGICIGICVGVGIGIALVLALELVLVVSARIWHLAASGLAASGSIWDPVEASGSIWHHLQASGTIWAHPQSDPTPGAHKSRKNIMFKKNCRRKYVICFKKSETIKCASKGSLVNSQKNGNYKREVLTCAK